VQAVNKVDALQAQPASLSEVALVQCHLLMDFMACVRASS